MDTLIRIDRTDVPQGGASGIPFPERYRLTLPERPEDYRELASAMADAAAESPELRDAVMNAAAAIVAESVEPTWMMERFGRAVRENINMKEENQTNI